VHSLSGGLARGCTRHSAGESAETVHIWLALAYNAVGQKQDAVREIQVARRLNPGRRFVAQVSARITSDQGGEP